MSSIWAPEDAKRIEATQGLWAGVIATTPALVSDKVDVTIAAFDSSLRWGLCRWTPRVAVQVVNVAEGAEATHNITVAQVVLPVRGNKCLVGFDDNGDPWVVVWWPFA